MLAMLVDDSRSTLLHLKSILEQSGRVEPHIFEDADRALDAARERHFDLVIVDHIMPKMDGITFIERMRGEASYAQVPIVMLTGTTDQAIRMSALEAGATDFLSKTSNKLELGVKLRNLITLSDAVRKRDDQAAWLASEVEKATLTLQAREEEMIFRLSLAVEYRDNATGDHTIRVARYSRMIAETLGLSAADCRSIYLAAPLHDIGKVAIPDHVLLKPGRLDDDEMALVRTHAAVGEHILSDSTSDLMRLASEIAGYHHERWDGGGYPRRIAADAIPLSARIVAVADVFDALITERPYKAAMPIEAALECLLAERGRHFDPDCVDSFMTAFRRDTDRSAAEAVAPPHTDRPSRPRPERRERTVPRAWSGAAPMRTEPATAEPMRQTP